MSGYEFILEKNRGAFSDDVKPLDEIEIHDSSDSVTCRVCGGNYANMSIHIRKHGIDEDIYSKLYPEAPLSAHRMLDMNHDWERAVSKSAILKNYEWIQDLQGTWLFEDDAIVEQAIEYFIEWTDGTARHRSFKPGIAGCLYRSLKESMPHVTPRMVSEATGVDDTKISRVGRKVGTTTLPSDALEATIGMVEQELGSGRMEYVKEMIYSLPPHRLYGTQPGVVVAGCTWIMLDDVTQKEMADMVGVNVVSVRQFRDRIKKDDPELIEESYDPRARTQ